MTRPDAIACVDIGKTNRRVVLVACDAGAQLDLVTEPNAPLTGGPYPALDLDAMMAFVEAALVRFARAAHITRIAISAHGAAFVTLAGDQPALPALDYEYAGPDQLGAEYAALRPAYAETFSPALPGGLNAGRGLLWLQRTFPADFARTDAILSLNQYIAFRLCGLRASECTALGAHTDLWDATNQRLSSMVETLGWTNLFPAQVRPGDILGPVRCDLAARTGLSPDCLVLCGIHDSNATLVPYLAAGPRCATVFSTGTWIIGFSLGGGTGGLDETRDCLANSDYLGRPVPSARMMGGRERALLAGDARDQALPRAIGPEDIPQPTFVPGTGPFARRTGQLPPGWQDRPADQRAALASLYCAFTCAVMNKLVDGAGPVIVEGVFARDPIFLAALAEVTMAQVLLRPDSTGTIAGLATLAGLGPPPAPTPADPPPIGGLDRMFAAWLARVEQPA